MTKLEQQRIAALTKILTKTYGPVMRSAHIREFLHMKTYASTSNWIAYHGLACKRVEWGKYYTDDVARAFVLGGV